MSKETAPQNTEALVDDPDRRLVLVGRGLSLSQAIGRGVLELAEGSKVLLVPSPAPNARDFERYKDEATSVFGNLGARVQTLHGNPSAENFKDPSAEQIANMVGEADALWISGGNTTQARQIFERTGIGQAILDTRGKVIAGGSAGALLQARQGHSWYTPEGHPEQNDWVTERGLGMLNATVGVHNDYVENGQWGDGKIDQQRSHYFAPYLEDQWNTNPNAPRLGLGIDDESAIAFADGGFKVINADGANPDRGVTSYHPRPSGLYEARFTPASTPNFVPVSHLSQAA